MRRSSGGRGRFPAFMKWGGKMKLGGKESENTSLLSESNLRCATRPLSYDLRDRNPFCRGRCAVGCRLPWALDVAHLISLANASFRSSKQIVGNTSSFGLRNVASALPSLLFFPHHGLAPNSLQASFFRNRHIPHLLNSWPRKSRKPLRNRSRAPSPNPSRKQKAKPKTQLP